MDSTKAEEAAQPEMPPTEVAFYAMDESESPETKVVSMTGLLVPSSVWAELRKRFHGFVQKLIPVPEGSNVIHTQLPELHGSEMLVDIPWATDEIRFSCFAAVVDIVNDLGLLVRRAGYYRHSVKELLERDKKLHGLNHSNLLWAIQPELARYLIVPLMDGLDNKVAKRLGGSSQFVHTMVSLGMADHLSIRNAENLCELCFASSEHSALLQMVDVVSYLLHIRDVARLGKPLQGFKQSLLEISLRLRDDLVRNEVITMQWGSSEVAPKAEAATDPRAAEKSANT